MTDTALVIDLSHWNTVTSFAAIAASGVSGVIHKATEGADYSDPAYTPNRAGARAVGLSWGAYHFIRPGNPIQQADRFLRVAKPDALTLLACDFEDDAVPLDDVKAFLARVAERSGLSPVLYSGSSIKACLGDRRDDELAAYRLWLAQYTSGAPSWPEATWSSWWLWQYTDTGSLDGIDGDVDLNRFDGSWTELLAEWSGASSPTPEPDDPIRVAVCIDVPGGVAVTVTVNGQPIAVA